MDCKFIDSLTVFFAEYYETIIIVKNSANYTADVPTTTTTTTLAAPRTTTTATVEDVTSADEVIDPGSEVTDAPQQAKGQWHKNHEFKKMKYFQISSTRLKCVEIF